MKKFYTINQDLYIHTSDIKQMESGHSGIGYIIPPNYNEYELINKAAFQPVRDQDILDDNSFSVVFICK